MKSISRNILNNILIISSLISLFNYGFASDILATEWIMYGGSSSGGYYYDIENVHMPSNQFASVWVKIFAQNNSDTDWHIQSRKKSGFYTAKDDGWKYSLYLHQLDCMNKKIAITNATEYSEVGDVLDSYDAGQNATWSMIVPDSVSDFLFRAVCDEKEFLKKKRDWKYYSLNNKSTYYYDANNIEHPSNKIYRLWRKHPISEEERNQLIESLNNLSSENPDRKIQMIQYYEDTIYEIALHEIDCSVKKAFYMGGVAFDKNDLSSSTFTRYDKKIVPTADEYIINIACKSLDTKQSRDKKKTIKKKKSN
jgi:hypothetical protein